jgi:branched-chain amino acid transport system permease protein
MKSETSYWVKAIQNGLIGGAVSLLLCLIGMVIAFKATYIISGVITMAQIFVFAPILLESYTSANKASSAKVITLLAVGALAGFLGGLVLAIPIILNQFVNLRAVLVNFSPALVSLLTFNLPLVPGIIVFLVVSTVVGMVGTGIFLLPSRIRRAVVTAALIIVFLGLFRDMLVTIVTRWGPLKNVFLWAFAQSGLTIPGTIIVFVLVGGLVYWRAAPEKKPIVTFRTPQEQRAFRWVLMGIVGIVVLLIPLILGSYFSEIFDNVGIYILMGLGLNIVVGFAGLLDLGYVAFYAIGAYTLGVLTTTEAVGIIHLTFWEALPVALVVAVFAGVVLGLPILRLRGDYLAIVTLGFGEIIRILVLSDWLKPLLGGSEGIQRIAKPTIGPFVFDTQAKLFYLILVGIIIAGFISIRLKDSHLGRSWMALREDEDVAEAMGINKVITKLLAFGMGALFSGLGGVLFATKIGSVYPQSFSFIVSINILSLIIIGGMGSIPGVFVGGLVLVGLPLLLSQFADFRYFIYGAALVYMMLARPEGLVPESRRRLELHEEKTEEPSVEPATVIKTPGELGGK